MTGLARSVMVIMKFSTHVGVAGTLRAVAARTITLLGLCHRNVLIVLFTNIHAMFHQNGWLIICLHVIVGMIKKISFLIFWGKFSLNLKSF